MMKHALLLSALAFALSACFSVANPAVPANSENSAAAQQARADVALQQAQQLQADAQAASANETAQAQAAQKVRELNATATAQAVSVAYAQMAMTANAANLPSTEMAILALQSAQALEAKGETAKAAEARRVHRFYDSFSGGRVIRLDTEYNDIMRAVAAEMSVELIEGADVVEQRPSDFVDYCHFNAAGHRRLGSLIAHKVAAKLSL